MAQLEIKAMDTWPWRYWAKQRPDSTALWCQHQPMSWLELTENIDAIAESFRLQGIVEGTCIALRGKNSSKMLLAYLAALQLGAKVLPLSPQLPDALLRELLPKIGVSFGWCEERYEWLENITPLIAGVEKGNSAVSWQPERYATLTLTSGSSGLPKAAVHTLNAHLDSAAGVLGMIPFSESSCWLLSLPLFHVSGQGIVWRWLYRGATMAIRDTQPLVQALEGCTHASLVPTQLLRLLDEPASVSTLHSVLLGGAMIPMPLTTRAEKAGIGCWCGYGLTEMASTVSGKRADGQPGVGKVLAGREACIVEGEIWLRGSCMASGYWLDGHLQSLVDEQGWFHSRDRGELKSGELHVVGRLDNLFFSGGEGIQPEDIERVLAAHPAVVQAFVVPVPDREFGHRPVAVIESDSELAFETLAAWVSDKLARFQQPIRYLRLDESLKTGGIKVSRQQVLVWVLEEGS